MLQARAKSEEQGLPLPGNACKNKLSLFFKFIWYSLGLYLFECNSVGKINGESFGEVYIHPHLEATKKVSAKTFVNMILLLSIC